MQLHNSPINAGCPNLTKMEMEIEMEMQVTAEGESSVMAPHTG